MIIGCVRVEYLTFVSNTTVLILADAVVYIPLNPLCMPVHVSLTSKGQILYFYCRVTLRLLALILPACMEGQKWFQVNKPASHLGPLAKTAVVPIETLQPPCPTAGIIVREVEIVRVWGGGRNQASVVTLEFKDHLNLAPTVGAGLTACSFLIVHPSQDGTPPATPALVPEPPK